MVDANGWMAIAAGVTVLFQVFIAAYFYGGLSQRVKLMADAADDWRGQVRQEFKDIKDEIRSLRPRPWGRDNSRSS